MVHIKVIIIIIQNGYWNSISFLKNILFCEKYFLYIFKSDSSYNNNNNNNKYNYSLCNTNNVDGNNNGIVDHNDTDNIMDFFILCIYLYINYLYIFYLENKKNLIKRKTYKICSSNLIHICKLKNWKNFLFLFY
jgi:hypothetical protein